MRRRHKLFKPLGDYIASVDAGVSANCSERLASPDDLKVLKTSAVLRGIFRPTECKIVDEHERNRVRTPVLGQTIILCRKNSEEHVGMSALVPCDYPGLFLPDLLWRITPRRGVDAAWLAFVLASAPVRAAIRARATGTHHSMKNISQGALVSIEVQDQTRAEQRRIAEILRTWDEAIEKTERLIAAKEAALFGHMHAATRDAEQETLGEGWVRAMLGDVTNVAVRRVEWDEAATYRRITLRRACGGLSLRGDALGSEILTKDMYVVKAGDFVISRRQVIHGAWAMARDEFDNTHVSKEYACLTARPDRLWMLYLDWLSRTPRLRHEALRCSYGVDPEKMVLNLDWLLKTPLTLPATIERQRKLAELLDVAQTEITLLNRQRDALAKQKRGLMQKLLTGEWQVAIPRSQEAAE